MLRIRHLLTLAIACAALPIASCVTASPPRVSTDPRVGSAARAQEAEASSFVREELYFGVKRRDTREVSSGDWAGFLDEVVTPSFPEGLTVLHGYGQYQMEDGTVIEEATRLIVLLYEHTPEAATRNDSAIRDIIASYKERFDQESVLRVTSVVRAAF